MKIYTKAGDQGQTSVLGARLEKTDVIIEAIGAIDELNSALGMAIFTAKKERLDLLEKELLVLSHQLFDVGADLANVDNKIPMKITNLHTQALEQQIDVHTEKVGPLKQFILPGGSETACALHHCRTEARKAERRMNQINDVSQVLRSFINRLSDYFFTVARLANEQLDIEDVFYEGSKTIK